MSPERVRDAYQAMGTWNSNFQVHITGGEPFLNFPLLLHAVQVAAEMGIPRYVETNAGWCTHPELVVNRFKTLSEAGLQAILISCSPYHAEKIPLTRTLLAIDKALDIFGPRQVMVYLPEWIDQIRRFGTKTPVHIQHFIESYGLEPAGLMLWEGYGVISGGRAGYQLGFLTEMQPAEAFSAMDCQPEILFAEHSHFDLFGNFLPSFCGGLSLGSWYELPHLIESYEHGNFPPLIRILVELGPYGLFRFAESEYGYLPRIGGYAGKCHLCVDVRRYLNRFGEFEELQPQGFYEQI